MHVSLLTCPACSHTHLPFAPSRRSQQPSAHPTHLPSEQSNRCPQLATPPTHPLLTTPPLRPLTRCSRSCAPHICSLAITHNSPAAHPPTRRRSRTALVKVQALPAKALAAASIICNPSPIPTPRRSHSPAAYTHPALTPPPHRSHPPTPRRSPAALVKVQTLPAKTLAAASTILADLPASLLPIVIAKSTIRRGKGGRQPAADPRLDPNIDPRRWVLCAPFDSLVLPPLPYLEA